MSDVKKAEPVKKDVAAKPQAKSAAEPAKVDKAAAKADPAKSHVVATWKHDRPLTSCKIDPTGKGYWQRIGVKGY